MNWAWLVVLGTLISPGVAGYWQVSPSPGDSQPQKSVPAFTPDPRPLPTEEQVSPSPGDYQPQESVPAFTPGPRPLPTEEQVYLGIINQSFDESARKSGLSPRLIHSLLDIFTGEIDFYRDVILGDRFEILISLGAASPDHAGEPQILAARIETRRKSHWAFYYSDGKPPAGYYDENGEALGGFRLLCPVKYPRITSGYSPWRYHPILKYYRPHLAVDYAAPAGKPIRAPASGIIEYLGWKNDWGRYLSLRHNSTYTTTYGHLSRYGPGIKKGVRVHQGQVIGYVGSSGLATRPHLCYRLLENGTSINPLTFKGLVGPPASNPQDFQTAKKELLAKLESPR